MDYYAIVWLCLMVLFLIAEGATVAVVSLWFAVGALVALITALFGGAFWLQLVLFITVSALLLACLRPWAQKYLIPRITHTNVDSVIGTKGYVTAAIDNLAATGQVSLNGMPWTARSTCGTPIAVGTLVRVDKIEGVKVFVSPAEVHAKP